QSLRPLGPTRARRAAGERDPRATRGVRADALARGLRSYGERRRARSGAHRRRARRGRKSRAGRAAGDPRSARDRIGPPVRRAARAGTPPAGVVMTRVLLAGVSTRDIAESAVRAGHEVVAVDGFGDVDLPASVAGAPGVLAGGWVIV